MIPNHTRVFTKDGGMITVQEEAYEELMAAWRDFLDDDRDRLVEVVMICGIDKCGVLISEIANLMQRTEDGITKTDEFNRLMNGPPPADETWE